MRDYQKRKMVTWWKYLTEKENPDNQKLYPWRIKRNNKKNDIYRWKYIEIMQDKLCYVTLPIDFEVKVLWF